MKQKEMYIFTIVTCEKSGENTGVNKKCGEITHKTHWNSTLEVATMQQGGNAL